MKKSNFWFALAAIILGFVILFASTLVRGPFSNLLGGMGGGMMGSGGVQLWKYRKWVRNVNGYREKLEQEQIDLRDERKVMLRDKSGRYAYLLSVCGCFLGAFVAALLGALGIVKHYRPFLYLLFGYAVFQYVAGVVIYRWLSRRY